MTEINQKQQVISLKILRKKKVDYLQKYDIKTKQNPEDLTFKLTDKKGGVIKNSLNCNIFSNPYMITKRDIYKLRNKTFLKEGNKKDNFDVDNIYMGNNGLTNDQGIEYIEKILQKPKKADLMKLATPRWKLNELEFKVPGPAYYHPRDQPKTLSFNRNNIDFIVTPGVFNEDDDNPIYDN